MPLNLDSGPGEGGSQFYDKLRFNAQGGVWFQKREDDEVRFNDGFVAVFDMETLQTGWSRFNGSFLDFIPDPSLDTQGEKPAGDTEEDKWKRSFKVLAYSDKAFGGVVEFMHQARTVTTAFQELYAEYESKAGKGKLPVVEVSGTPKKVGDYYAPSWSIKKMTERPDALSGNAQAAAEPATADVEFA
jgi:hypothetical protein